MTDLHTRYLGLDLRTPIVASASPLNGDPHTARLVEQAGASAIVMPSLFEEEILHEENQLNSALEAGSEHFAEALDYFPAIGTLADAGDRYLAQLERIKAQASVPVIASLNATTPGGWVRYAELMASAGADVPLRWIAILRPHIGPGVSLAATSGVESGTDVVKALMAGADVAMTTSALLRHGPAHLRVLEAELVRWLDEHEYESVSQLRGSATHTTASDAAGFERANYMRTLRSWVAPTALTPSTPNL